MNNKLLYVLNQPYIILVTTIILAFILGLIFGKIKTELSFSKRIKHSREDAIKRSKAVLGGQMAEQIAPFLPEFPCNPQDARFIGKPVDFIAFKTTLSENEEKIEEILLIEVKTGDSKLSAREKQVKECVEKGKIRYVEYHF